MRRLQPHKWSQASCKFRWTFYGTLIAKIQYFLKVGYLRSPPIEPHLCCRNWIVFSMCPGRCAEHRKGCLDATNQQWPRTNPFSREEDGTMWNLWLFFSGQWCNGAHTIPHDWKAACGFWSSPWVCHRISGVWVVTPNRSSLSLSYFHLCLPIPLSNFSCILFEITTQAKGKSL